MTYIGSDLCAACNSGGKESWIQCNECKDWFHFDCCGLTGLPETANKNLLNGTASFVLTH